MLALNPQFMYHKDMTQRTCGTPGHEGKPAQYTVGDKDACQACYRKAKRAERGPRKPGPNPDASKPFSRHNTTTSHHRKHDQCANGHPWVDGSFKIRSDGKRVCLVCIRENRPVNCPQGHPYDDENTYYANGSPQCKACRNQRMRDRRPASG